MNDKLKQELQTQLRAVEAGYDYSPGDSDLDDEQPIHVRMTLGNYRKMHGLLWQLEKGGEDKQP